MTKPAQPTMWQRFWRLFKPDRVFAAMTLLGAAMIALSFANPDEFKLATISPWARLAAMIPLLLALAYVATLMAGLDRRKIEDYHFQLMSNGAIIGIITAIFGNMVWLVFVDTLGTLTANNLIGMIMFAWGLGYFFYRSKGLNP